MFQIIHPSNPIMIKYFLRSTAMLSLVAALGLGAPATAQEKPLDMKMDFEEYDPPSSLVVEEHHLKRSKFPFIDIHNHQGNMNSADLSGLIKEMDKLNM